MEASSQSWSSPCSGGPEQHLFGVLRSAGGLVGQPRGDEGGRGGACQPRLEGHRDGGQETTAARPERHDPVGVHLGQGSEVVDDVAHVVEEVARRRQAPPPALEPRVGVFGRAGGDLGVAAPFAQPMWVEDGHRVPARCERPCRPLVVVVGLPRPVVATQEDHRGAGRRELGGAVEVGGDGLAGGRVEDEPFHEVLAVVDDPAGLCPNRAIPLGHTADSLGDERSQYFRRGHFVGSPRLGRAAAVRRPIDRSRSRLGSW